MKFVVNGMLGSLARWLRMLGYEADYDSKAVDNILLEKTKTRDAILLTRDEELYNRARSRGLAAVQVFGNKDEERLGQLAKALSLALDLDMAHARCPECGSVLHEITRLEASSIVPKASLNHYDNFWRCTNLECGKTYWLGSHMDNIRRTLQKAREIMEKT